ncbi:MAG: hypothetical protein RIS47_1748 [Bacteroidota bacterium]
MDNYQEIWKALIAKLGQTFGVDADLTEALYLIGVQELGKGFKTFSKQEKMDLIHVGNCKALEPFGYYQQTGFDDDKWPTFEKVLTLPPLNLKDQEALIKKGVIQYFQKLKFI